MRDQKERAALCLGSVRGREKTLSPVGAVMQVISGSDWSVGLNRVSRNTLMDKRTLDKLGLGLRGLYRDLTREPVPEFLALFIRTLEEREQGNGTEH